MESSVGRAVEVAFCNRRALKSMKGTVPPSLTEPSTVVRVEHKNGGVGLPPVCSVRDCFLVLASLIEAWLMRAVPSPRPGSCSAIDAPSLVNCR